MGSAELSTNSRTRVGLVAVSSPAYAQRALALLAQGDVVVPLRDAEDHDRITAAGVAVVEEPAAGHGWVNFEHEPTWSSDLALIAFTSGTEGHPKGVLLSHRALADVVDRLRTAMGVDGTIREYIGVPVYHSFGFGRCRVVGSVGGRAYLPENGFDPIEVAQMLRRNEINAISAVPSLWRTVLDAGDLFEGVGERVRWIEIGSQYMSRSEKEALRRLFPSAKIVQHYGLTEASRSTFLEIDAVEGDALDSVGRATGDVEVKIADDGRVMIRGPHVASSLLVQGQFETPVDETGWYTTNDQGHLRDGYLFYEGRADDVINCGGLKLSPERLEAAIRKRTRTVADFAVCRVPDRMRGDGILLVCESGHAEHSTALVEALAIEAAAQGVNARGAIRVTTVDKLPRTSSGKVQRKLLAADFADAPLATIARGEPHELTDASRTEMEKPRSPREQELWEIWRQVLNTADLRVDESFYDLGGDSVTALSVVVRMKRAGLDINTCRRIFQGATIRELAAADSSSEPAGQVSPTENRGHKEYVNTLLVNALRGALVIAVIAGHWSEGALQRLGLEPLAPALAPVFGFGTPGFAIVFGLGFGYLYLDKTASNARRVWAAARLGTIILGGGVLLYGAFRLATRKAPFAYESFFEVFYSPLTFYLLAIPTMPLWGRVVAKLRDGLQLPGIALIAVLSYGTARAFESVLWDVEADGFFRLVRLMLVAKFNYFDMLAGVLMGAAAGLSLRRKADAPGTTTKFVLAGLGCAALGVVVAAATGEIHLLLTWPSALKLWKWIFYLGLVLMTLGALLTLRPRYGERSRHVRRIVETFATLGQLALPLYVLHEMVLPLKAVAERAGLASGIALATTLLLFFAVSAYMFRRVQTLFHSA